MLKSLIVQSLIVLSLSVQSFAQDVFYIGLTASGSGNASSWANKDDVATFNWASAGAGDTVKIDGGSSDSLGYPMRFLPTCQGNSSNNVVIKGAWDSGHNGRVVFYANPAVSVAEFNYPYVTIENLTFQCTGTTSGIYYTTYISADGVIFQNNTVHAPPNKCIKIVGCDNAKILNNDLLFGYGNVGGNPDGIWMGETGHSVEIAYNRIINLASASGAHKDNIQTYFWQDDDIGITKIHHNLFACVNPGITDATVFEVSDIAGRWEVHNNIILFQTSTTNRAWYFGNCTVTTTEKWSGYFYNNTVITYSNLNTPLRFHDADTLVFKNNLVVCPNGNSYESVTAQKIAPDILSSDYWDIDYNQYTTNSLSTFLTTNACESEATYSWSSWQNPATFGGDIHGEAYINIDSFDFVGTISGGGSPSLNTGDYALEGSSSGINEGVDLSSTGIDEIELDFNGNTRTGTWDVGAFEFGSSPPAATKKVRVIIIQ